MPKFFSKRHLSRIINGDITPAAAPGAPDKVRLDHRLVELYPDFNRSTLQKFVHDGRVTVNGNVVDKPNYLLLGDEEIHLDQPLPAPKQSVKILYEDDDVIVFDKPAGLLSMAKGAASTEPTVADLVGGHQQLVHRLDRDTSGVIITAKSAAAKAYLQKQFQNRKTHKTYYAVVEGRPKLDAAVINLPIARNLKAPTTFKVDPAGREAITEYKVLRSNDRYSLLELKPQTGRTHQLRVHLAYIGTPILGDRVYGSHHRLTNRMSLHAHALEITLPGGKRTTFVSPLPEDFTDVLE
jgi:23S rRNA pseudouridine1911/1915/1917 synthase